MKNSNKKMISSTSVNKLKSTLIFILIYLECNLKVTAILAPLTATSNLRHLQHNHHNIRHSRHLMSKDKPEQRLLHAINLFKQSNNSNSEVGSLHRFYIHKTITKATTFSPSYEGSEFDDFGIYRNDYYQKSRQQNLQQMFDSQKVGDIRSAKTYHQKRQPSAWSKYFERRQETKQPYRPFKRYDYNYNFDSSMITTTTMRNSVISQNKFEQSGLFGAGGKGKSKLQRKSLQSGFSFDDMTYDYLDEEQDEVREIQSSNSNLHHKDDELVMSKIYEPGSLTQQKYNMLGTRTAVEKAHNEYINQRRTQHALADAHASKIQNEGACRLPKPRLVTVHPDPTKIYQPPCTLLHQCSDHTGCCYTLAKTCVAKSVETVKLLFLVTAVGSNKKAEIEELEFTNHTECHCVNRELVVRSTTVLPSSTESVDSRKPCACPSHFESRRKYGGDCECDCFSVNTGCDWLKKGLEHFSLDDRRCMENECTIPNCEFGIYERKYGRCPRKSDKLSLS